MEQVNTTPPPMQQKSKEEILKGKGIYQGFSSTYTWDGILAAMEEYGEEKSNEANEFIGDIAKLLGEDGLGFDDLTWTIDDFKNAINEYRSQPPPQHKSKEEIIKQRYPFYNPDIAMKDVELNGEQVMELMESYASQFKSQPPHGTASGGYSLEDMKNAYDSGVTEGSNQSGSF